ncbi:MAG: GNAT family N-acetyltransferase [Pelatocladus maniniholoensis HA4357-MV3]|jgi:predicted GNAT family acetyltransferase|uniref:GNAT family N-acetyltransferase n=1 Tax=Pelatocladus maniniholoensis HA4357-MV3 TaxID=1117104 RepID=A0A9E3HDX6_9NOST|nr:GNAT family N-acetyltransferase [Pelatocladus maniniholoensis HA4357-MV3]BAZ67362.1 GCN5-related N-acetyltransferase [Fischerella sp. NIES-4106]
MIIIYKRDLENVDWEEMKATLSQDKFDNGRSPEQLRVSFANSYATCIAYAGDRIIGTARVLSDGVCNAYIVDVWTFSPYRHQGIATTMMRTLLTELQGQHVCLFTDDTIDFYKKLGFTQKETCLELVVGNWLNNQV